MAVQTSAPIPQRPRNVIASMRPFEIRNLVARSRGPQLRALLDAAQDVAKGSDQPDLRRAAEDIVAAAHLYHPDYFDATLKGA